MIRQMAWNTFKNTGDVNTTAKPGYRRGCGCKLSYKVKNVSSKCPVGKW